MNLTFHKTKIICTIGPASRSPHIISGLIKNGMDIARLNFSHASFAEHQENIRNLRRAAAELKSPLSIFVDLPGVKIRIGHLDKPLHLKKSDRITLTTRRVPSTSTLIPVNYQRLPQSVTKDSIIYLSDGFIQLKVEAVRGRDIHCRVVVGGLLLSQKGLNLPGAKLTVNPITAADFKAVEFCLSQGVTCFGLSFVQKAADVQKVREFAKRRGKNVFLIAKIERHEAVQNFDEILEAADAVMIARGDLGIEIPIETVPVIQKQLIRKANIMGRPVITATQMLGSMTQNVRPTRAEVTDVANAIVDGTDAIMMSEETAVGEYPIDAVQMMAKIALSTEHLCHTRDYVEEVRTEIRKANTNDAPKVPDVISINVVRAATKLKARCIITQTNSGSTARHISRFKPNCWIFSFSTRKDIGEYLNFSYGVYPFLIRQKRSRIDELLKVVKSHRLAAKGDTVIITERRFSSRPGQTDSLGILTLE